jgi:hypothetical protein
MVAMSMTLPKLKAVLDASNVQLTNRSGKLSVVARKGVLTDQLKQAIRQYESELLDFVDSAQGECVTGTKSHGPAADANLLVSRASSQIPGRICPIYWSAANLLSVEMQWLEQVKNSNRIIPIWFEVLQETILLIGDAAPLIDETLAEGRVIYSASDLGFLCGVTPRHLQRINQAKRIFGGDILNRDATDRLQAA